MGNEKTKKTMQETGRWMRVIGLSLSVLGPVINSLVARINEDGRQKQAALQREEARLRQKEIEQKGAATLLDESQERLQAIVSALAEVLGDLKDRPYSQELIKRGEELAAELRERGSRISQVVVERSGQVTQDIGELSHELAKRGEKVSKELSKRGRKATQQLSERNGAYWITLGFAVGLTTTTIVAAFLLVRRKINQASQEETIQLAYEAPKQANQNIYATAGVARQQAKQQTPLAPADAIYVGVVSTKRYYPVETPLDQFAQLDEKEGIDVVYFTSEDDAKIQGFLNAEQS